MVGASAGLALRGRTVFIMLAAFLCMRAFEFIRTDIGISGLPVKFSVSSLVYYLMLMAPLIKQSKILL